MHVQAHGDAQAYRLTLHARNRSRGFAPVYVRAASILACTSPLDSRCVYISIVCVLPVGVPPHAPPAIASHRSQHAAHSTPRNVTGPVPVQFLSRYQLRGERFPHHVRVGEVSSGTSDSDIHCCMGRPARSGATVLLSEAYVGSGLGVRAHLCEWFLEASGRSTLSHGCSVNCAPRAACAAAAGQGC